MVDLDIVSLQHVRELVGDTVMGFQRLWEDVSRYRQDDVAELPAWSIALAMFGLKVTRHCLAVSVNLVSGAVAGAVATHTGIVPGRTLWRVSSLQQIHSQSSEAMLRCNTEAKYQIQWELCDVD